MRKHFGLVVFELSYLFVFVGCSFNGSDDAPTPDPVAQPAAKGTAQHEELSQDSASPSNVPPVIEWPATTVFEPEEGFTPLSLDDFHNFPSDANNWSQKDQTLYCTGQPRGYLYTKKTFRNFVLRCDYRFLPNEKRDEKQRDKSNTGFLIYITGEHKTWPKCLEVQGKHVEMAHIKSNSRDVTIEVTDNEDARQTSRQPVGEWNRIEIISQDGALTSFLNGTKICESQPSELQEGHIGIQAEDFPFFVRNLRIQAND